MHIYMSKYESSSDYLGISTLVIFGSVVELLNLISYNPLNIFDLIFNKILNNQL